LGIFLLVVGAILTFAVRDAVPNVDLTMVGWICMAAGLVALILGLIGHTQATNQTRTERIEHHDGPAV